MRIAHVAVLGFITCLVAHTALAAVTAQQKCDSARIGAWKKFQACVDGVVAKKAKDNSLDGYGPLAKCRHKYFGRWAKFQSYTGSTCVGPRFTDNGDQTVTDNLSSLVWEKKSALDVSDNPFDHHDADNNYSWSTGAPYKEDGTAFNGFLSGLLPVGLNVGPGFAGAWGWRLPTLAELQTIVLDFECKGDPMTPTCVCPSDPCVDAALDAANTADSIYWSGSSYVTDSARVWYVDFALGEVGADYKIFPARVRATRGGF